MDYKEKYEQALEKAREIHSHLHGENKENYEKVFPELKESEDILSALKMEIKWLEVEAKWDNIGGISFDKVYAWLEKQGERKPVQEIEPFEAEHGKYYYCIKDYFCGGRKQASKGDVIQALRGLPIMGLKDASEYFLPVNNVQNPAWSEEDEVMLQTTIDTLEDFSKGKLPLSDSGYDTAIAEIQWLKSLKPQPHWKPTEEQIEDLKYAINMVDKCCEDSLQSLYNDLKKL